VALWPDRGSSIGAAKVTVPIRDAAGAAVREDFAAKMNMAIAATIAALKPQEKMRTLFIGPPYFFWTRPTPRSLPAQIEIAQAYLRIYVCPAFRDAPKRKKRGAWQPPVFAFSVSRRSAEGIYGGAHRKSGV